MQAANTKRKGPGKYEGINGPARPIDPEEAARGKVRGGGECEQEVWGGGKYNIRGGDQQPCLPYLPISPFEYAIHARLAQTLSSTLPCT